MSGHNKKPAIFNIHNIGNGSLSVMAKPNSGDVIEQEFSGIAKTGIHKIISLLEPHETEILGLNEEKNLTIKNGMEFVSYPIKDRGMPASAKEFGHFTKELYKEMHGGLNTLIHCHGGIGRSGIMAASVLLHHGFTPEDAFKHVSEKREISVPDTQEQIDWVVSNAADIVVF